jgi:hypothetical protein
MFPNHKTPSVNIDEDIATRAAHVVLRSGRKSRPAVLALIKKSNHQQGNRLRGQTLGTFVWCSWNWDQDAGVDQLLDGHRELVKVIEAIGALDLRMVALLVIAPRTSYA